MKPTPEQIAALADDQLEGEELLAVAAAVEADPELQRQVQRHRDLRNLLGSHLAPIVQEPVPDRLADLLRPQPAPVIELAAHRARRTTVPRWVWAAGPALAASLVLTVLLRPADNATDYATPQLASALDRALGSDAAAPGTPRILLSFRDKAGAYCRAYSQGTEGGIACRDAKGWKLLAPAGSHPTQATEYRMAGSAGEIMAAAQEMAAGPALDAAAERAARGHNWQPSE